jgi:hypothetical protein
MSAAVEEAQVKGEKDEDATNESNPVPSRDFNDA